MIGLLGLLVVLFLGVLALGYKVCLMGSKEKGALAVVGIIIGLVIIISSLAGVVCTTVYLHKRISKMGIMGGMPPARPGTPNMRSQRQPGMGMPQGMNTPPAQAQTPRPQGEEKR